MLYHGEQIFGDHNFRQLIGNGRSVMAGGEPRYLVDGYGEPCSKPRVSAYGSIQGATPFHERFTVLSREEIRERAIDLERTESRVSDLINFSSKDQNGTSYCWNNGVVGAVEACREMAGLPYVSLSPASVGGPITGYRNVGGWGEDALKYISENGIARSELWPDNAIEPKYMTAEVKADYENHQILEWFDLETDNVLQLWTMLVHRIPVPLGLNWWGHLIYGCDVVVQGNSLLTRIRNSWNDIWGAKNKHGVGGFGVLEESRSRGSQFGVRAVTASRSKRAA